MQVFRVFLVILALAASSSAFAQSDYPTRPLRLIVPFPPGGGNDLLARLVSNKLQAKWGQPVVVENKPGAGGNTGAEIIVRSPADGYTLLLGTNTLAINPHLLKSPPFDVRTDFAMLAKIAATPFVMVVNPKVLPVNSISELITYAKANPGKLSYASVGIGTPHHLGMELFKSTTQIDMVHVPYRGSAAALPELLAGQTQLMLLTVNAAIPGIEKGDLRPLGVGERRRISTLPNVPTIIDAGVTNFEVTAWYGIMARAGTPDAIQRRLTDALLEMTNEADTRDRLVAAAFEMAPAGAAETRDLLLKELEMWGPVVRNAGIQPE